MSIALRFRASFKVIHNHEPSRNNSCCKDLKGKHRTHECVEASTSTFKDSKHGKQGTVPAKTSSHALAVAGVTEGIQTKEEGQTNQQTMKRKSVREPGEGKGREILSLKAPVSLLLAPAVSRP